MEDVKIYGLCLDRLKHQTGRAREQMNVHQINIDRFLLESYNTDDIEDIVDILELYDLEEQSSIHLKEKLRELEYTISLLLQETLKFDYTHEGHLGLFLLIQNEVLKPELQTALTT
ncbi:MAG: hypothetical protein ISR96_12030 [Nitrospira sp.]|nr:hypothetical protein [bacterium]MBL7050233.1 hypothetical protein [Nitrospira sp.]